MEKKKKRKMPQRELLEELEIQNLKLENEKLWEELKKPSHRTKATKKEKKKKS